MNGVLASTGPAVTMAPNIATTPMRIGQHAGAGQYWPGVIDDASFFPAALTASQVAAHYDASVNGSTATSAATAVVGGGAPVAPSNTGLPVVSGTAQEGLTVTASSGSWSGTAPISFAYQWRRCDSSGGACVDVGGNASSYVLAGADVGSRMRVVVTASNGAGSSTAVSSATAPVVGLSQPPVNQTPPTISGTAQVGQTLTALSGSWSGSPPISYAYQWRRCDSAGGACVDIAGATAASYVVSAADSGSTLRVRVAASNGATVSVYSNGVVADSPVSYWRVADATGPLVDSRGFKNGSYVNEPQRGVPGLITGDGGTAVSLDGATQYLEIPADPVWTSPTFSIELVVKPEVLPDNRTIWSTQEGVRGWWLNTDVFGVARMFIGTGSSWQWTTAVRC